MSETWPVFQHDGRSWRFEIRDEDHYGFRSQDEEGELWCLACNPALAAPLVKAALEQERRRAEENAAKAALAEEALLDELVPVDRQSTVVVCVKCGAVGRREERPLPTWHKEWCSFRGILLVRLNPDTSEAKRGPIATTVPSEVQE